MAGKLDHIVDRHVMPRGPFAGQALTPHKRSVHFKNQAKNLDQEHNNLSISNFRQDGHWWTLQVSKTSFTSIELIQQFTWDNDDNVHTMVRLRLDTPALLTSMVDLDRPNQSVQDFILSITPHEANGQKIIGRENNLHTTAYRAFPTNKILKASRSSHKHHFYSYKLDLTSTQIGDFLESFVQESETHAGRELFHYENNNCSSHLWNCFFKLPELCGSIDPQILQELKTLSLRGKNSLKIAAELNILGDPSTFFSERDQWRQETLQALLRYLNRPVDSEPFRRNQEFEISPKRNPFLKLLYKEKLIDNGWQPFFMGDKLLTAQVIEACSDSTPFQFHPKSRGVMQILSQYNLIDTQSGEYRGTEPQLQQALGHEFPNGFVVKRTMDYGSNEDHFFNEQDFYKDIATDNAVTYRPNHYATPFVGRKFGRMAITSGEYYFFMEKVNGTRLVTGKHEPSGHREYRVHSLFDEVVDKVVQSRWDEFTPKQDNNLCIQFLQEFLDKMPWGFHWRQGLSFDCFIDQNNQMQLIEMNTNRGRSKFWSDFLRDPEVISSYVLHIEKRFGWKFKGLSGELLKNGLANLVNHTLSDLLYFNSKISTENYNEEFILATVSEKNQKNLNKIAKIDDDGNSDVFRYLQDVKPFALEYSERVRELKSVNSPHWKNLTQWAKSVEEGARG